ncbi:MAG: carboxypeptidase-like regulatory domain-containing protein [Sphingomicrobium sp.]
MKRGWPSLALIIAACTPGVSGQVRDANSDRPIANAEVAVTTSDWGIRDGGLVWDKNTTHRTTSGPDGKFQLSDMDGGHRLAVRAAGYAPLLTSLCSRSPMIVRVGGPFDGANLGQQMRLGMDATGARLGWRFGDATLVPEPQADLVLAGRPSENGTIARLVAPAGLAFSEGTGNPPTPPHTGYARELTLDLLDCGWLFVRTGRGGTVPVQIGGYATDAPLEGGHFLMLSYLAAAPARR